MNFKKPYAIARTLDGKDCFTNVKIVLIRLLYVQYDEFEMGLWGVLQYKIWKNWEQFTIRLETF